MRLRKPFTLYAKTLKSGKTVYYYRVLDESGKLLVQKSTGQSTKTAAETYCYNLVKKKCLIPEKEILFLDYARNFWVYDKCLYIKGRLERNFTFTRSYADVQRLNLKNHILPFFGKYKLNLITEEMIDSWLFSLKEKGLHNKTVNHCLCNLRVMINEACRRKIIKENPILYVKRFKDQKREKGILTEKEVRQLFNPAVLKAVWINLTHYTANLLATCTGMRLGEVQALRAENIFPGYIQVCHSWDRKYGLKGTKTNTSREIPIPPALSKLLAGLISKAEGGFIFSANGGETPLYFKCITAGFYKALGNIGISEEERKGRNLSFHSYRHLFNSRMRGKIADHKLQLLTGHSTQAMTEHYTHINREDLQGIKAIQESFFLSGPDQQAADKGEGGAYVN